MSTSTKPSVERAYDRNQSLKQEIIKLEKEIELIELSIKQIENNIKIIKNKNKE